MACECTLEERKMRFYFAASFCWSLEWEDQEEISFNKSYVIVNCTIRQKTFPYAVVRNDSLAVARYLLDYLIMYCEEYPSQSHYLGGFETYAKIAEKVQDLFEVHCDCLIREIFGPL
jgi:hypothetical protein